MQTHYRDHQKTLPHNWSLLLALFIPLATAAPLDPVITPTPTLPPDGHLTHVGVRSLWTHGPDFAATPVPSSESVSTRCCLGVPLLYISEDTSDCEAWSYTNDRGIETFSILDAACAASVSSHVYSGFYPLTGCWQWEGYYTTVLSMTAPGETMTAPPKAATT